jgi:hypothetical protein
MEVTSALKIKKNICVFGESSPGKEKGVFRISK